MHIKLWLLTAKKLFKNKILLLLLVELADIRRWHDNCKICLVSFMWLDWIKKGRRKEKLRPTSSLAASAFEHSSAVRMNSECLGRSRSISSAVHSVFGYGSAVRMNSECLGRSRSNSSAVHSVFEHSSAVRMKSEPDWSLAVSLHNINLGCMNVLLAWLCAYNYER